MAEKKRRARGEGSIRQRKDGTWEARFVAGVDPGTGKDNPQERLCQDTKGSPKENDRGAVAGRMGGGISGRRETYDGAELFSTHQESYQANYGSHYYFGNQALGIDCLRIQ